VHLVLAHLENGVFPRFFLRKSGAKNAQTKRQKSKNNSERPQKKTSRTFFSGKIAEQYWKGEERQRKRGASEDFLAPHPHYLQFELMN
jgi:hypothetical protein